MDFIGWFLLGVLGALVVGLGLFGAARARGTAALAQRWGREAGLLEVGSGQPVHPLAAKIQRAKGQPAFSGVLEGVHFGVFQWRTRPRWGPVWVFCAHAPGRPPVSVQSRVGFIAARTLRTAKLKGFEPARTGNAIFDATFYVDLPSGVSPEDALPTPLRDALLAQRGLWELAVRKDGLVLLFVQDFDGGDVGRTLKSGLETLRQVLRAPTRQTR